MEILLLLLFFAGLLVNPGRYRTRRYGVAGWSLSAARLPFYAAAVAAGFLVFAVIAALGNA